MLISNSITFNFLSFYTFSDRIYGVEASPGWKSISEDNQKILVHKYYQESVPPGSILTCSDDNTVRLWRIETTDKAEDPEDFYYERVRFSSVVWAQGVSLI
jgi:hypothetical protein